MPKILASPVDVEQKQRGDGGVMVRETIACLMAVNAKEGTQELDGRIYIEADADSFGGYENGKVTDAVLKRAQTNALPNTTDAYRPVRKDGTKLNSISKETWNKEFGPHLREDGVSLKVGSLAFSRSKDGSKLLFSAASE